MVKEGHRVTSPKIKTLMVVTKLFIDVYKSWGVRLEGLMKGPFLKIFTQCPMSHTYEKIIKGN